MGCGCHCHDHHWLHTRAQTGLRNSADGLGMLENLKRDWHLKLRV